MAVLLDSTGKDIGLWQPGDLEGFEFTGAPGSPPVWFELMSHRFDDASTFYTDVVDAHLVPPMGEPMDDGTRYSTNGGAGEDASWGGLCDATGFMPEDATGWRIYLGIEATDAALSRLRELGGSVLDGPVDSPPSAASPPSPTPPRARPSSCAR